MVRQTTPEEFKIIEKIKRYRTASLWADFDSTRNDIGDKTQRELEKRMEILLNPTLGLRKMEAKYESLTGDQLPSECSDILGRFENSCERIYITYANKINEN
jgi:hypothetical protein